MMILKSQLNIRLNSCYHHSGFEVLFWRQISTIKSIVRLCLLNCLLKFSWFFNLTIKSNKLVLVSKREIYSIHVMFKQGLALSHFSLCLLFFFIGFRFVFDFRFFLSLLFLQKLSKTGEPAVDRFLIDDKNGPPKVHGLFSYFVSLFSSFLSSSLLFLFSTIQILSFLNKESIFVQDQDE